VASSGYLLARSKLLNKELQKNLGNLNLNLFTPCLVFIKIASTLTFEKLAGLWMILFIFAILSVTSFAIAKVSSRIFHLSEPEEKFAIACSVFQNSNSYPIALISTLAYSMQGLEWDDIPHDTKDQIASRGILYLVIYSQLGLILRWSYGFKYLLASPIVEEQNVPILPIIDSGRQSLDSENSYKFDTESFSSVQVNQRHWIKRFGSAVWELMNPPLWSMIVAFIVASVPTLKNLFFGKTFVHKTLTKAVESGSNVAIPLIVVVLGANLYIPKSDIQETYSKKLAWSSIICRMLISPLLLCPLLALAARYLPISVLDDPIFILVSFLLIGSPTAITLSQICQINGVFEDVMTQVLWWSYGIFVIPSAILCVLAGMETIRWATGA